MSTEFALAWDCPHLTIEERVSLALDRRMLQPTQPIASGSTVRVFANDEIIPQGGLLSVAQVRSSLSGPFSLPVGYRTLTVETSQGVASLDLVLSTGRLPADQVVLQVRQSEAFSVLGLGALAENGFLCFSDEANLGLQSYVRISGSAAEALGFGNPAFGNARQYAARGRVVYPGWHLVVGEGPRALRIPRFDAPIKGNPSIKLTYSVPSSACRRCGGTQVENDMRSDVTGQSILIRNEDLLYQAVMKALLTVKGSNPYYPWYGTRIQDRIGSKNLGGISAAISEDIRRTLSKLQELQKGQGEVQIVTAKERLYSIQAVRVLPHAQDRTTVLVDVDVQNASGEPISLSIVYATAGVVALMGSNGLSLGTGAAGLDVNTSATGLLGG